MKGALVVVAMACAATFTSASGFSRQSANGLSVVFLYDVSVSVSPWELENDKQYLQVMDSLAGNLRRTDTLRFGVVARKWLFTDRLSGDAVTSLRRLMPVMADEDRFGPSPLWDAMYEAVTAIARDPGQRVVIVVTDGQSTGNVHGTADLTSYAVTNRVSLSAVGPRANPSLWSTVRGLSSSAEMFAGIAQATGGICLSAAGGECRQPSMRGSNDLAVKVALVFDKLRRSGPR